MISIIQSPPTITDISQPTPNVPPNVPPRSATKKKKKSKSASPTPTLLTQVEVDLPPESHTPPPSDSPPLSQETEVIEEDPHQEDQNKEANCIDQNSIQNNEKEITNFFSQIHPNMEEPLGQMKFLAEKFSNEISSLKTEIESLKTINGSLNQLCTQTSKQKKSIKTDEKTGKTTHKLDYLHFDKSHKDEMAELRTKFLKKTKQSKQSIQTIKDTGLLFDSNKTRLAFIKEADRDLPKSFSGKRNTCNLPRSWINKIEDLKTILNGNNELQDKITVSSSKKFAKVSAARSALNPLIKALEKYSLTLGKKNK